MKGDLTRATFRPERHFASVRQQQGRVLLDADWNEQADIDAHRRHTTAGDLIGPSGGPLHAAAFGVRTTASLTAAETTDLTARGIVPLAGGDVLFSAGRYYVDGILCESEQIVSLRHQPDVPGTGPVLPNGRHLVYLHVWEQHLTWLDDALLREVALNGPDTATRARVVWQIGTLPVPAGTTCLGAVADYDTLIAPSTGTLRARAAAANAQQGPCVVSADAGYTRLENQLFRVEIHRGGAVGTATFKWSRDNGAVVTSVTAVNGPDVTVGEVGRDALLSFAPGQFVEATDDARELAGQPGDLFEIESVDASTGVVRLSATPTLNLALHPRLRRWDGGAAANVTTGGFIALGQDGVEIRFAAGNYRTGDYWTIPARTTTGDVEWPRDGVGEPIARPPAGIVHHYARLALVDIAGGALSTFTDCRSLFPPVTELTDFEYLGGDGQEVMPNLTAAQIATRVALASPLRVGVSNGRWPVAGARVFWEVLDGDGRVQGAGPAGTTAESFTDPDGVATCTWSLLPTSTVNRVRATLRDVANNPVGLPIVFGANVSVASQVAYDPRTVCGSSAPPVTTVQAALDRQTQLCRLFYAGGDGQEALPTQVLPQPLRVSVANACGPVQGATVTFAADAGGRLATATPVAANAPATLSVTTDAGGVAQAFWVPANDATRPSQACVATLSAAPAGLPLGSPVSVRFGGRLSLAAGVGYTPASNCSLPASVTTVQAAIDQLCAGLGAPLQRIVIQSVNIGGAPLANNALFSGPTLAASGIDIVCDRTLDALAATSFACEVVLDVLDASLGTFVATRPQNLMGTITVQGNTMRWRTNTFVQQYLQQFVNRLFWTQARLVVRGNFVFDAQDPERYLDPNLFMGRAGSSSITRFPTGDGVRGGEMQLFFWLGLPFILGFGDVGSAGATVGTVTLEQPAPEGGVMLRLATENPAVTSLPETVFIPEGETRATFDATVKAPRSGALDLQITSSLAEIGSNPVPEIQVTHDLKVRRARK